MFDPIQPPAARWPEETLDLVSQALSDGDLEAAFAQYESTALVAYWPYWAARPDRDVRGALTRFMDLRLPLSVRIAAVLETPDLALVICERQVTGVSPHGEQIELSGLGCAMVRRQPDGTWRIAADAWQVTAERPAERGQRQRGLAGVPGARTALRSE
jgi:ketosteroid isomerase-like protein